MQGPAGHGDWALPSVWAGGLLVPWMGSGMMGSDLRRGASWDCRVGRRLTLTWRVQREGGHQEGLVGGRQG